VLFAAFAFVVLFAAFAFVVLFDHWQSGRPCSLKAFLVMPQNRHAPLRLHA
jgi:hypothetical protein